MESQAVLLLHNKAALQATKLLRSFFMLGSYFDISEALQFLNRETFVKVQSTLLCDKRP